MRMRPLSNNEEGETIVQKTSGDSLSMLGHQFTFDHVADTKSTQVSRFLFGFSCCFYNMFRILRIAHIVS